MSGVTGGEGVEAEEREEQVLVGVGGVGVGGEVGVGEGVWDEVGCEGEVLGREMLG